MTAPRPSHLLNSTPTVVLIDGLTRSGKSLLGPILSSFERAEIERMEPDLEWIGDLWHLGQIQTDGAVTFLRLATDRLFYEGMIGRNTNFRFGDHSSVWRAPRKRQYVRRLFLDERLPFMERVAEERPIFQNMVHHQLMNFALFDAAFGDRLRMLEMIRDPVDLVDSWMRKRKGDLIGNDPLISMVFIEWQGRDLPWYAAGWEEEYLHASPLDRVIRMIAAKWRLSVDAWREIGPAHQDRLFVLPLEDFSEHPEPYLRRLAAFVGSTETGATSAALRGQRVPRRYDRDQYARTREGLLANAGPVARAALEAMIHEHAGLVPSITL